jgi:hypothetical protein
MKEGKEGAADLERSWPCPAAAAAVKARCRPAACGAQSCPPQTLQALKYSAPVSSPRAAARQLVKASRRSESAARRVQGVAGGQACDSEIGLPVGSPVARADASGRAAAARLRSAPLGQGAAAASATTHSTQADSTTTRPRRLPSQPRLLASSTPATSGGFHPVTHGGQPQPVGAALAGGFIHPAQAASTAPRKLKQHRLRPHAASDSESGRPSAAVRADGQPGVGRRPPPLDQRRCGGSARATVAHAPALYYDDCNRPEGGRRGNAAAATRAAQSESPDAGAGREIAAALARSESQVRVAGPSCRRSAKAGGGKGGRVEALRQPAARPSSLRRTAGAACLR